MKVLSIIFLFMLFSWLCPAQEYTPYGTVRELPVGLTGIKKELQFPQAWGNSSIRNFNKWRRESRKILLQCLQRQPAVAEFRPEVIGREQREGYQALKIVFNISAYDRVPAYLLIPEGEGPFPAVLMLHDHGAKFSIGKEKMVKPFGVEDEVLTEADKWAVQCYDGQYTGDYYARNGYVVLSVDALFWGERGRKEGVKYDAQQALSANLLQLGMSWGGVITWDDLRCVEFLESMPEVDAGRIGALGFSMGAHRAWMLAAATDKVKAAAAVCWMNTTDSLMTVRNNQNKGQSAYSMIVPGLRNYLDYPHTASVACPKPMLFFNGSKDKLFPVEGVKKAYEEMYDVWKSQKAEDRLVTKIWDSPHFFSCPMQEETLLFFDHYLK